MAEAGDGMTLAQSFGIVADGTMGRKCDRCRAQGHYCMCRACGIPPACSDETKAVEFMEKTRWNGEPFCPNCGCFGALQLKGRDGKRNARFLWLCKDCGKQFTVRVGTIFQDSKIPLRHWCYAFWAACAGKKGVAALEIKRMTGLSYKSALFMMHRIRFAMLQEKCP